ncbi:hypothetical protein QM325_02885 [Pseudomonas putida]|nr:hypothetical protein [Pseudomonas putida]
MPKWAADFAGVRESQAIYDYFEIACLLTHISVAEVSRAEMKERLKTGNFHYLVSGLIKWNEQSRKRIATGLSLEEYGAPLLRAGFAQGDKEYLDTFIEGLQHHMR